MLQLSLICLLAVHLVVVNVASGGPFVCIWLAARARRGDLAADLVGRKLARWSLDALSLGVLLGISLAALLWWLDERAFFQALARIEPRRLAFGGLELLVYYLLMAWYLASWGRWLRLRWMHPLIALIAGTNLVYHFPILFTVLAIIAERGETNSVAQPFVSWLLDPELLARVGHFCLASIAVTGAALLCLARTPAVRAEGSADRVATWGAHLMLWPTLLQLPLGLYVLLQLPERSRDALLGGDLWGTCLFAASLLAVMALLHQLGTAVIGQVRADESFKSIALIGLVVLLMVGVRERSRRPLLHRAAPQTTARGPAGPVVAPLNHPNSNYVLERI